MREKLQPLPSQSILNICILAVLVPELERVKKQFKSYSDEKEKELHSLVKRIRELENNLRSCTSGENSSLYAVPEGVIASFESDADVENLSLFKAPGSLVDEKGKRVIMMVVEVVLVVRKRYGGGVRDRSLTMGGGSVGD